MSTVLLRDGQLLRVWLHTVRGARGKGAKTLIKDWSKRKRRRRRRRGVKSGLMKMKMKMKMKTS
jgi:hypothetical protein